MLKIRMIDDAARYSSIYRAILSGHEFYSPRIVIKTMKDMTLKIKLMPGEPNLYEIPGNRYAFFSRAPAEKADENKISPVFTEKEQNEKDSFKEDFILCRICSHIITTAAQRINVNGTHQHTFANPSGIIFDIGCFKAAPGCIHAGPFTEEFSWFKGFRWQVSICASCMTHLGWFFRSPDNDVFSGLILDRLRDTIR